MIAVHRQRAYAGLCALALCALAGGHAGCGGSGRLDDWVDVKRDDLILGVEVEGVLKAVDSDMLGPPAVPRTWNFKIAYMAAEGQQVDKGTPILAFDGNDLEQKLQEKQNERDTAKAELEKKRLDVRMTRRQQDLDMANAQAELHKAELQADQPEQLSARIEVRKARLDLELARERVAYLGRKAKHVARRDQADISALSDKMQRAEQRVNEIQTYISRLKVNAPRAGTIIYTTNRKGEKKKIGDNIWWQEKVLEVASLDRMRASGMVAEMHASRVASGQHVRLRLDALPDVQFSGTVESTSDTVQRKSADIPLQVVELDIALEHTDAQRMRPGMRFRGTVETGRVEHVLVIPIAAVFIKRERPIAYRKTSDGYQTVELDIGARNQTHVEVRGGLREGDRVSLVDMSKPGRQTGVAAGAR